MRWLMRFWVERCRPGLRAGRFDAWYEQDQWRWPTARRDGCLVIAYVGRWQGCWYSRSKRVVSDFPRHSV